MAKFYVLQRPLDDSIIVKAPLKAECLVVHSTANPGATDEDHFKWLNADRRHGWAHYYLDWDSISLLVSEGFQAPAQGPTMNAQALSIEICEPDLSLTRDQQHAQFHSAWARAVWLAANILSRYGWTVSQLLSHAHVSELYPSETDHTDPTSFFTRYGKSWDQFVAAVDLAQRQGPDLPPAELWQQEFIDELLTEGLITQRRHPLEGMEWWEGAALILRVLRRQSTQTCKAEGS